MTPTIHRSILVNLARDLVRYAVFDYFTAEGRQKACRLCGSKTVSELEPIQGHHAGCSLDQLRLALHPEQPETAAKTAP